jgi:hypothetical protein
MLERAPPGRRQQPELKDDDQDEKRAEDEVGNADAGHGDAHGRVIHPGVLANGAHHAGGDTGEEGEGHGHYPEGERDRSRLGDDLVDRSVAVAEGGAEVAVQEVPEIAPELLEERLIQMVAGAERRLDLRWQVPLGVERPTGSGSHEEKGEEEDEGEERDEAEESADDVGDHGISFAAADRASFRWTCLSRIMLSRFGSQPPQRSPS